jgi:hypothetical protein
VIIFQASRTAFPVIDLRSLCNDPKDYSELSAIEPSALGGVKIAKRIAQVVENHNFGPIQSMVY